MASEQVSKQAAVVAAGSKNLPPKMGGGAVRAITITSPDTVTWANGDTLASPIKVPKGSRFIGANVSCADMGTSITLDVGFRDVNGVAIDADGIVAALDVAAAAVNSYYATGAKVAAGVEYITTEDSYVYLTLNGGTPTANAQMRVDVLVVTPN